MKVEVLNIVYKYGSINEKEVLSFDSLKKAKEYVKECTSIDIEPEYDDFLDFDNPIEDFKYYHSKWLSEKNATKDSCKWFQEFYHNEKLIGKGILDC